MIDIHDKSSKSSVIFNAFEFGHLDIVQYMIKELNFDLKETINDKNTLLHSVAESRSLELVKYLVFLNKKDLNALHSHNRTALDIAWIYHNILFRRYLKINIFFFFLTSLASTSFRKYSSLMSFL